MKSLYRTALPAPIDGVMAVCPAPGGGALIVASDASLWKQGPDQKPAKQVPVTVGGHKATVWDVTSDHRHEIWLVAAGPDGVQVAGKLSPGSAELSQLDLGKREPQKLAWSKEALWFTSSDTRLNTAHNAKVSTVESGRYNAILTSPSGARVVARRITDSAVLERVQADPEGPWHVRHPRFEGHLVGVADDGTLLLLTIGLWRIGEGPAPSKLIERRLDGKQVVLSAGPFQRAGGAEGRLAIVSQDPTTLMLEMFALTP
jgi:hypothetical protein